MLIAFLLLAQLRHRSVVPVQQAFDWKIEVTSTGGITGGGVGGFRRLFVGDGLYNRYRALCFTTP